MPEQKKVARGLAQTRFCRNGANCVISVAGHGAALSRMFDTGDLCLRCWQRKYPANTPREGAEHA